LRPVFFLFYLTFEPIYIGIICIICINILSSRREQNLGWFNGRRRRCSYCATAPTDIIVTSLPGFARALFFFYYHFLFLFVFLLPTLYSTIAGTPVSTKPFRWPDTVRVPAAVVDTATTEAETTTTAREHCSRRNRNPTDHHCCVAAGLYNILHKGTSSNHIPMRR